MMSRHGSRPKYQSSLLQEGTMDLYIETLTGTAFEMTVSPFDTVISIKSKIQRVEGIPVSHQHLLYNQQELDDSSCLLDYSIQDGATLKLVLAMRGGPISTRRIAPTDDTAWKELKDFVESNREDVFDHLPQGCRVTVLVFKDGDHVNLFRVIENEDGTYSPLSESWSGSSIRNLFAEDDPEETAKKFHENSVTMDKMRDLRSKMEALSLQKKQPKKSAPRVLSAKKSLLHVRKGSPRQSTKLCSQDQRDEVQAKTSQNFLHLPPLTASATSTNSSLRFRLAPLNSRLNSSVTQPRQSHSHEERSLNIKDRIKRSSDRLDAAEKSKEVEKLHSPSLLPLGAVKHIPNKKSDYSGVYTGSSSNSDSIQKISQFNRRSLLSMEKHRSEMKRSGKQSVNHVMLNRSKSTNVLGASNIAIVEEDGEPSSVNVDADFSPPSNAIPVPSKEATTFTLSQVPRERITSVGSGRYRVSRLVLDEECRPKTSPDKLSQRERSTLEMWGILTDPKWQRHRRRPPHCNSNLDLFGFPASNRNKDSHSILTHSKINEEKPVSLSDMPPYTPKFGRSVNGNVDALKERENLEQHTSVESEKPELKPLRRPRQRGADTGKALEVLAFLGSSLPRLPVTETEQSKKQHARVRCAECRKKLNITNTYTCRCEKIFCSAHRYSELHNCTYDYKSEGRKLLEQSNPLIRAPKLPKI